MYKPSLTGPYAVGSDLFSVTDDSRTMSIGPNAGKEVCRIPAKIYYPASKEDIPGHSKDPLMTRETATVLGKQYFVKIPYDKKLASGELYGEIYEKLPFLSEEKFPLILFNHGYLSYMEGNSFLCSELASQGYVVISVGHPYEAMSVTYEDNTTTLLDSSLAKRTVQPPVKGFLAL